ncbi:MAG: DUF2723 domain-containing protein [Lentisphaerae bacterium]|nr:DUF2723 domain-containing protein [Lentisphaerota bacterium]
MKEFFKSKRTVFLALATVTITWLLIGTVYWLFGHDIVKAAYEGCVPLLSRTIVGQSVHSVEFYFAIADRLVKKWLLLYPVFLYLAACMLGNRLRWTAAALLVPVITYCLGMAPSLVGGDGDEFLLQAFRMGIAHPCGYPVYLWIGKLFLIMTGNSFATMNMVSVVFAVLTLLMLWVLMRRMRISSMSATVALMFYAFSPTFWMHAMRAEVYNVNAAFVTVILLLFFAWHEDRKLSALSVAAFVYGLSLGVHFSNILMSLPIAIILIVAMLKKRIKPTSVLLLAVGPAMVGAMIPFAYIWFRSQTLPPTGTMYCPSNFVDFVRFISGAQYGATELPDFMFAVTRVFRHLGILMFGFMGIGFVLSAIGLFARKQSKNLFTVFLIMLLCFDLSFFTFYRVGDFYVMTVVSHIVIALFLGRGMDLLYGSKRIMAEFVVPLCACGVTLQMVLFPHFFDQFREDLDARERGEAVLVLIQEESTVFAPWNIYTSLRCVQTLQHRQENTHVYEISNQARYYGKGENITRIIWQDYVEENIGRQPIYCIGMDSSINSLYDMEPVGADVYRLSRKE